MGDSGDLFPNYRKNVFVLIFSLLIYSIAFPINSAIASNSNLFSNKDKSRKETSGYALSHSIYVGEKLKLNITCPTKTFFVKVFRVGFYDGKDGKIVHQSGKTPCIKQDLSKPQSWKTSLTLETKGFISGMYLLLIIDNEGYFNYIPVVLKANDSKARALFSVPIMTMQAYNTWSGADTYGKNDDFDKRLRTVDFRQPYNSHFGTGKYLKYVHSLIVFIEELKLDVEYVADTDLHFENRSLLNKKVFISAGHDEYWTIEERNNVLNARKAGVNTLFFGANAGYWNTRLIKSPVDNSLKMEVYKSAKEDPNKINPTIKFRDMNKSESELTGLEYKCFPAKGDLRIKNTSSFVFNGIKNVDKLNLREIVGPEVDTLKGDSRFEGEIFNLADSRVRCGDKWYLPRYGTMNMILGYSANGQGGLFSTGTMGWVMKGLSANKDSDIGVFTRVVTKNVLERALIGPLDQG